MGPVSHFQNLDFGKASTEDTCHLEIASVGSCQYQCMYIIFIQIFLMVQELWAIFKFLQFGHRQSLDQRTDNDILQPLGLDLVNINGQGKFHQTIP